MAPTVATQLRRAVVTDLKAEYVIEMLLMDRGDLPDGAVFLLEIFDENDPKDDTLARVCTVADMDVYRKNRAQALLAGDKFFRSIVATKSYPHIEDAVVAKDFLVEQVNALVSEYATYANDFKADPAAIYVFPMINAGVLAPAVNAYTETVADAEAQREVLSQKQAACSEVTVSYTQSVARKQAADATLSSLLLAESAMQTSINAIVGMQTATYTLSVDIVNGLDTWNTVRGTVAAGATRDALDDQLLNPTGALWAEYYSNFTPAKTAFDSALTLLNAQLTTLAASIATQTAAVAALSSEVDQLLVTKESCALGVAEAQQVLNAQEREAAVLLDKVRGLCPTFTP